MNNPAAYTHLETLLLWEHVCQEGVTDDGWARVSDRLTKNASIKSNETFDPSRLRVEPLQTHFYRVLQQELWGSGNGSDGQSGAPLPTWRDLQENLAKVNTIIERLYERYKSHQIKLIRDDEEAYDKIQMDIRVLEKNEAERLKRLAANQNNAQPALAPKDSKPASTASGTPSPAPSSATLAGTKRGPTPNTPVVPPKQTASGIAPPSHLPAGTPIRSAQPGQAAPGSSSVLQAPQGVNQRILQAPTQASKVPISPRPEAAKPKDGTTPQAAGPQAQGTLKWEKPYQPPGTAQGPPRQTQSPVPPKAATPQQYAQSQQQWQQQQQQNQYYQQQGQATTPQQLPAQTTQGKPVLAAPQGTGVPQIQPGPPRPTGTGQPAGAWPQSKTPVPPPHRPIQPQQPQAAQHPRPIAASPTPPAGAGGLAAPPQRWPQGHVQQAQTQRNSQSVSPAPGQKDNKPYASPYTSSISKPPIPEHMIRHAAAATPNNRRISTASAAPSTPAQVTPTSLVRGFGTKWAPQSTPSTPGPTPGPQIDDLASPAYEPVSPPLKPAGLPRSASSKQKDSANSQAVPVTRKKRDRMKSLRGTPGDGRRRSQSVVSDTDELSLDHPAAKIKDEEATPRPHEEAGDTTADESVHGRGMATPGSISRGPKRKRQDTPPEPPGPPEQVLWTKGFTKVSSSALDQISSHRDGNMFATAVREKDAPGYRSIVLQPQDITGIRSAIKQGNKAAVQAAASLPGAADASSKALWLPISEDLTPPKGIINSAQLERELVHMFCNAIMYNFDPNSGFPQGFMKRSQEEEEEILGYQMDEFGVVLNTQSMFVEVEKLLGDLRNAEKDRTAPAGSNSTPRHASAAATPAEDTAEEEDELAAEGEATSGTAKRRRTTMRS